MPLFPVSFSIQQDIRLTAIPFAGCSVNRGCRSSGRNQFRTLSNTAQENTTGMPTDKSTGYHNYGAENRTVRLNKYLAGCGLGSRRACDELIAAGKVFCNGQRIKEMGMRVDPDKDRITCKGKQMVPVRELEYWMVHKPKGPLITHKDPENRETIFDFLKKRNTNLDQCNYVGRLDRNSEGLLLVTNDGTLIHAVTHPRYHIKKVYRVRINRPLAKEHVSLMISAGVKSRGQLLHAGAVKVAGNGRPGQYWYEIELYEGKNRQVRRMFEELGYSVLRLKRTQFGPLRLGTLPRGACRQLIKEEVAAVKRVGYRQNAGHGNSARKKRAKRKA
ncbi:MAG: pseudouridine synthase [Chitinivibrionales bacterium]|nr:pseudouridine synthase [Chitinivibrionales bacterium]